MILNGKKFIIGGQILIILVFFTGMWANYFLLSPIITLGETFRITSDVDDFFRPFTIEAGCDLNDTEMVDSLLASTENVYDSDFIIMDGKGRIILSKSGESGNAFDLIRAKYGPLAIDVINSEISNPQEYSRLEFDSKFNFSYYADYHSEDDILYFGAIDYDISGSKTLRTFGYLFILMIIGGILVVLICFFNIRKMGIKIRDESIAEKELETAAAIQKSMLPQGERHLMQIDVDARLIPASKIGGDFYSYVLKDGYLYFCVGDVSGKGVPASLFMSKAVTLFRSLANESRTPSSIAAAMNNELCISNDQNMFITSIIGRTRAFDGNTEYVNAGHEMPVIWNGNEESSLELLTGVKNIPLGVMPGLVYEESTTVILKNGLLLMYTDGITEAKSKAEKLMGRDAVIKIIEEVKDLPAKQINDRILEIVNSYADGADQYDDITLLTFRNIIQPKVLVIKNEIKDLRKIASFVEEIFKECPLDGKAQIRVRSGLDEALTNCVHYAYDTKGEEIVVSAVISNRKLIFEIVDSGREFDPLEYRPDESTEIKVGGLGIPMIKNNFDNIRYDRTNGQNHLYLVKNL